jgi:hypothetical protein
MNQKARPAGQDIGNFSAPSVVVEHKGQKADPLAYARSKKKVYLRKIERQKKLREK